MITRLFFMLQLTTMCSHWQEKKTQLDRDVRTDNAHTGTQNTHGGIARWAYAYYTWAHMWCFKAMSVFQKSTCKSWQNCLRIWNQSRACNWFWCLSTRSASKWGQEAHVNTDNATKIFSAQVLPATHTAFIRCYTTHVSTLWLHVCVSAHACVGITMQMSGSASRTWLVVCITDASASLVLCLSQHSLALHSQLLAYATCMQDTLKIYHLPYMPSKMKIGSLISATHNKKNIKKSWK